MAITHKYVDFLNGDDANSGDTDADAYKTIQFAINGITDGGGGQQINIKSNAAHVLVTPVNWSTGYSPTNSADNPLMIRGYTSIESDGGVGEIDGNNAVGNLFVNAFHPAFVYYIDLKAHNTTDDVFVPFLNCCFIRCEMFNGGISATLDCSGGIPMVIGCHLHTGTLDAVAIFLGIRGVAYANFITGYDDTAIHLVNLEGRVIGNLIVSNGGSGIAGNSDDHMIINNTIIGDGATASRYGIQLSSTSERNIIANNIIKDWSAASNIGINFGPAGNTVFEGHNLFHNNTVDRGNTPLVFGLDLTINDVNADPVFVDAAGDDYSAGINIQAVGYPDLLLGSQSTSFVDIGAIQRREGPSGLIIGE